MLTVDFQAQSAKPDLKAIALDVLVDWNIAAGFFRGRTVNERHIGNIPALPQRGCRFLRSDAGRDLEFHAIMIEAPRSTRAEDRQMRWLNRIVMLVLHTTSPAISSNAGRPA